MHSAVRFFVVFAVGVTAIPLQSPDDASSLKTLDTISTKLSECLSSAGFSPDSGRIDPNVAVGQAALPFIECHNKNLNDLLQACGALIRITPEETKRIKENSFDPLSPNKEIKPIEEWMASVLGEERAASLRHCRPQPTRG